MSILANLKNVASIHCLDSPLIRVKQLLAIIMAEENKIKIGIRYLQKYGL